MPVDALGYILTQHPIYPRRLKLVAVSLSGASTPPPLGNSGASQARSQRQRQERDDAWQRERERAIAVSHAVTPPDMQHEGDEEDRGCGVNDDPAPAQPSFGEHIDGALEIINTPDRAVGKGTEHARTDTNTNNRSPNAMSISSRQSAPGASGEQAPEDDKRRSPAGQKVSPRTSGSYRLPETTHAFGEQQYTLVLPLYFLPHLAWPCD